MKCQLFRNGGDNRRGAMIKATTLDMEMIGIKPGDTLNVYLHDDKESLRYVKGEEDFGALSTYTVSRDGRQIRFTVYPDWVKHFYGVWRPGLVQFVEVELSEGQIIIRKVGK